jgi:integrase
MARRATGQLIVRRRKRGTVFGARIRVNGDRHYVTLGYAGDGMTEAKAQEELGNLLADARRGLWSPPVDEPEPIPAADPTFHEFASEWLAMRRLEGLKPRTVEDYEWSLTVHLLPFFARYRLSQLTVQLVDRYKVAKADERQRLNRARDQAKANGKAAPIRGLSNNTVNKTLRHLSTILETAVEYGKLPANPASGKRRRLPTTRPRRPWIEPEQLMTLLKAAEGVWGERARPLIATLVGAGLRIGELLALDRRHVNLARGTLEVADAKTAAGVRTVDLIPSLRDELAAWLDRGELKRPTDPVFPTATGRRDNRNNARKLLRKAIAAANELLIEQGIEPIGAVTPHGLRRTYATLRCAVGDDVAYTAEQLGHEDARFTLRVYTAAVKRRDRLTTAERREFDRAIEWAQWAQWAPAMGTGATETISVSVSDNVRSPGTA